MSYDTTNLLWTDSYDPDISTGFVNSSGIFDSDASDMNVIILCGGGTSGATDAYVTLDDVSLSVYAQGV